jgi:hypothetical protein
MAEDKKPTGREPTDATRKALDDFHKGFAAAHVKDREELAKLPKVHDHEKGEFVEEVDPKLADR